MTSKGVNIYCFGSSPGYKVRFTVPAVEHDVIISDTDNFSQFHLEMDSSNISGPFNFTGPFIVTVLNASGNTVASWTNNINSLFGNVERGALTTLSEMNSVVQVPCIVTIGFYDAGSGVAGLPNSDECFVTVAPYHANWMGQVAPISSAQVRCAAVPSRLRREYNAVLRHHSEQCRERCRSCCYYHCSLAGG